MAFQKVNGTNYYYQIHGKGPPLVLISGYVCDHTLWMPVLDGLSQNYQVLVFDNRAIGQTKDQGQPLKLKELAKDTIDLAESLGLEKPNFVGQSMGGTILQTIAHEYRERVGKIVLLVTTNKWRKAMLLGLRSLLDMRENNLSFDEIFGATLAWVFGEAFISDKKMVKLLYDILKNNPYPQSLEDQKRQFALLEEFDGTEYKITAPTLVVNGKEDIVALHYEAKDLADSLGAELKTLPGAHGVIAQSPEALIEVVHHFLSS